MTGEASYNPRSEWTPEDQESITRTVRALAMTGILDWENRIASLERVGQRRIDPPAADPEPAAESDERDDLDAFFYFGRSNPS